MWRRGTISFMIHEDFFNIKYENNEMEDVIDTQNCQ